MTKLQQEAAFVDKLWGEAWPKKEALKRLSLGLAPSSAGTTFTLTAGDSETVMTAVALAAAGLILRGHGGRPTSPPASPS